MCVGMCVDMCIDVCIDMCIQAINALDRVMAHRADLRAPLLVAYSGFVSEMPISAPQSIGNATRRLVVLVNAWSTLAIAHRSLMPAEAELALSSVHMGYYEYTIVGTYGLL